LGPDPSTRVVTAWAVPDPAKPATATMAQTAVRLNMGQR
jgi:hypothetical protein